MNLTALTPCCVDYYPQLDKSFMGGNTLNLATMWKKKSPKANISVITCLGNDENGKRILKHFENIQIDTSRVYIKEGKTANNQLRVDEFGERFGIEGTWDGGVYETFLLSEDDWEFVSKQDVVAIPGNNPNFQEMIKRKNPNQLLSVDFLDIENKLVLEDTVEYTDIAFITATKELLPKYENISKEKGKLIVVTLGAEGSYAFLNGKIYFQEALPIDKVIDTTGCGDAYQAAFALSYYKYKSIPKAMLAGAEAALEVLQVWGGVGL